MKIHLEDVELFEDGFPELRVHRGFPGVEHVLDLGFLFGQLRHTLILELGRYVVNYRLMIGWMQQSAADKRVTRRLSFRCFFREGTH